MTSVSVSTPVLVDPRFAYNAAIESTPSLIHSLLEDFSNCKDYGREITISVYGEVISGKSRMMRLRKVVFEDDGCGMSHDTVCERFRGSYFDSASHGTSEKSGRNGVGVKTNFKYWGTVEVETTTADVIPRWVCRPENLPGIEESWKAMSKLKTGDADTEKRFYRMTRNDLKFMAVQKCEHSDHGTKVTLSDPIGSKVMLDLDEFISRLGHSIEFLDDNRHPDHSVTLCYPNSNDNMTCIKIKPFHKVDKIGNTICEAVRHPGSKDNDKNIIWVTASGQEPIAVPGPDPKILGDVEIYIKVMEQPDAAKNQFVMSICGSNVYDSTASGGRPYALTKVCNENSLSSVVSFFTRIFGYVRTNEPRLKQALRLNRTALDDDDPVAKEFFNYLSEIFKALNKQFIRYMDVDCDIEDANTLSAIKEGLNITLSSPKGERVGTTDKISKRPEHHWWVCLDCDREWKAPVGMRPLSCCEGDINNQTGCYGSRVERKKNDQSSSLDVRWVPFIGNFVPARYDANSNVVELAKYHPDFILDSSSKAAKKERVTRGVERALFAVACYMADVQARQVETVYAELLNKRFTKGSNKAAQNACRKLWKKDGVDPELI